MPNLEDWPDCAVEGCTNKCCLALNSVFCFPHTPGNKHVKHMKIDARNYSPDDEPLVPFSTGTAEFYFGRKE